MKRVEEKDPNVRRNSVSLHWKNQARAAGSRNDSHISTTVRQTPEKKDVWREIKEAATEIPKITSAGVQGCQPDKTQTWKEDTFL